ncbi:MAG TPA: hypothetical protein VNJ29_00180 [Candidatus Nitrosotenuis sp.]|nr:hypothetical protein [Candidatus Nitrosotenuis sp.]
MRRYVAFILILIMLPISLYAKSTYDDLPEINDLNHNKEIVQQILKLLSSEHLPNKRKALYKGLLWMIRFTDPLDNFKNVSEEYLMALGELHHSNSKIQRLLIRQLLTSAISRLSPYLTELYQNNLRDYLNYLYLAPTILEANPKSTWVGEFCHLHFSKRELTPYKANFYQSLQKQDYDKLTDYMSETAMIDLLQKMDDNNIFGIDDNPYRQFHQMMTKLPWDADLDDDNYSEQNYCMTHVVLSLNHYGRQDISIPKSWRRKLIRYHWHHYPNIRYQVDDLDLLAEFLYDLKVLRQDHNPKYQEGISYLLTQQNEDGSWGDDDDFNSDDLYDVFHPTWTVLSALNMDLGTDYSS